MTIAHGFTYEIVHGEDFDPDCDVCSSSTEILHKILGEWLEDACFVDTPSEYPMVDPKRMVILKSHMAGEPVTKRIGDWFVEIFDETIKLAAVEKILFRDSDTDIVYEFIITY